MIIGGDIDGFVPESCDVVFRDELSDEGAAGTVDREYFIGWVRKYLVPTLGNYGKGSKY